MEKFFSALIFIRRNKQRKRKTNLQVHTHIQFGKTGHISKACRHYSQLQNVNTKNKNKVKEIK